VARHKTLPKVDHRELRQEAEEHLGEDRIGDDDPWARTRG
jgi:hypothetical protein